MRDFVLSNKAGQSSARSHHTLLLPTQQPLPSTCPCRDVGSGTATPMKTNAFNEKPTLKAPGSHPPLQERVRKLKTKVKANLYNHETQIPLQGLAPSSTKPAHINQRVCSPRARTPHGCSWTRAPDSICGLPKCFCSTLALQ